MNSAPPLDSSATTLVQPVSPAKKNINWNFEIKQYGRALIAALPLFILLSVYLYFRRGYYDLYIANKIFAGVGAILLGLVLLIGPGSRMFSFPDRLLQYRKHLGIVAFFLVFIHSTVSLFFLPSKFPLVHYLGKVNIPFIFSLLALFTLIVIFLISNHFSMMKLGHGRWWHMQNWGIRLAFVFVVLHVYIMKWGGWVSWYKTGGGKELVHPEWPGAGLLVGWFMFFVIMIRIAEALNPTLGRIMWYTSVIVLPIFYIITFWWGNQFI